MRTFNALSAAGGTDAGLQREVNEDRYHVDEARGLFVVIDGIGGQAAGGKAADVALSMIRERLERETGPDSRPRARSDRDRQQRDLPAQLCSPGMGRHGLCAHGRRPQRRYRDDRSCRRHASVQNPPRPHREDHQGSFSNWRTRGCQNALRIRGDAAPAPQRGVSRRRIRASLAWRCGVRRCAGDSFRARCSAAVVQ